MLGSLTVIQRRQTRGQHGHHPGHIAGEPLRRVALQPELLPQPVGMGEVVEGDHGLEAALVTRIEDAGVAIEGLTVEGAFLGLEPRPFDGQPERVASHPGGPIEGDLGIPPEVTGVSRRLDPTTAFPPGPIVRRFARSVEAALDLEAGRGHPEQEVVGKGEGTTSQGGHGRSGHGIRHRITWARLTADSMASGPEPGPTVGPEAIGRPGTQGAQAEPAGWLRSDQVPIGICL